jgi:carboxyl-terminal processing protease
MSDLRPTAFSRLARRAAVLLGLCLVGVAPAAAATAAGAAPPVAAPPTTADAPATGGLPAARLEAHLASFDAMYRTVKDKHWDLTKVGEAWDAAYAELRLKLLEAETDGEARSIMQRLLGTLGQSHFSLIAADAYDRMGEESASAADGGDRAADMADDVAPGSGWHGLDIRLVGDELLVTRVQPGSPAEAAGIHAGWALEAIGDRPAARIVEIAGEIAGLQRREVIAASIASSRLSGDPGQSIEATFRGASEEPVAVTIDLIASPVPVASFGNLPPMPVEIISRTLESGVGYFRLGSFFGPDRVMPAWSEFITTHADAPGIVLDLRGNPGGIILMSTGLLNYLIPERGQRLGTMNMRDPVRGPFEMPIMINPRGTVYDGPVAVLIDEMSMSNSEILAGAIQDLGRGFVVGGRTAGLVLPSTAERLPNGDGFLYAFAGYARSSGVSLEGDGVTPDVTVDPGRSALLAGIDPALVTAVGLIVEHVPVGAGRTGRGE